MMKSKLRKSVSFIAAFILMAGLMAGSAKAASEQIKIPATLIKGFYQNGSEGVSEFLTSEEIRCFATICAYLDWYDYDKNADFLLEYAYIGKDKEGEVLWFGLGGRNSSIVLAYAPENNPDYYSGVEVELSGLWVSSFIEVYCDPLYHNSETTMKTVLERLDSLNK